MRNRNVLISLTVFCVFCSLSAASVFSEEKEGKWPGVDESVVEKVAKEHGREARDPLINTDKGDLLLFVFLLAGVVGGFIGGYYWRMMIAEKSQNLKKESPRVT